MCNLHSGYTFYFKRSVKPTDADRLGGMPGVACGDVGVSQVDEVGTVSGRSLRP